MMSESDLIHARQDYDWDMQDAQRVAKERDMNEGPPTAWYLVVGRCWGSVTEACGIAIKASSQEAAERDFKRQMRDDPGSPEVEEEGPGHVYLDGTFFCGTEAPVLL
jgi:hypothetical protein